MPKKNTTKKNKDDFLMKMLPYHYEAECAVLCGLMRYPSLHGTLLSTVKSEDFFVIEHATIFSSIKYLIENGIPTNINEIVTIVKEKNNDEEEKIAYKIADIYSMAVLGASASWYAEMLKSYSLKRKIINSCYDAIYEAQTCQYTDSFKVLERLEGNLNESCQQVTIVRKKSNILLQQARDTLNSSDNPNGIMSGYHELDEMTTGFLPEQFIIIGARPGMGKSALALSMADHMARQGIHIAFFSLEMSLEELSKRHQSIISHVPLYNIKKKNVTDQEREEVFIATDRAQEYAGNLEFFRTPNLTPSFLRMAAQGLKREDGSLDCIIIDYLQLMGSEEKPGSFSVRTRENEVAEISRSLKNLSKDLQVPIIALVQLNREIEKRGGSKRALLSDIRESGAIEQDADMIIFLSRDKDEPGIEPVHEAELYLAKNRNGQTGIAHVMYDAPHTHFVDISYRKDI